jgi:CubicO group peptidase (beta-lactamase class C family)
MSRPLILLVLTLGMPPAAAQARQFAPDARVDSVFAAYDRPDAPGCAVGVYRDGRIQYARGYGLADLERRVPISPATVFDIGSTSKQFTAAVIVLLAQEGRLSLDDDVRRFLPELPVYQRPVTVRHLLHHTSGLRDYIGLLRLAGMRYDDVTTPDDALRMLTRQRALNFAPGDEHLYSNSGYFLLSQIVERITGRSLREEARDRIFTPLGMTRTQYLGSYNDVVPDRALGYEPGDSGYVADMPRWLQLGDGAVLTTVEDLLHWEENFRTTRVGGEAMRDALLTRGRLASGEVLDYALGLMHGERRGLATVFHGGSWGGYRAEFLRFPGQRYGVAVLCNRADANPPGLAMEVAEIHLAEAMDPLPAPAAASPAPQAPPGAVQLRALETYAGTYRVPHTSKLVTIAVVDGALRVLEPGRYDLAAQSADELEVVGIPVRLMFEWGEAEGAPARRFTERVRGSLEDTYERVTPVSLTQEGAEAFVGTYHSAELATSLLVSRADTVLNLTLQNASPVPLRPLGEDEFLGGGVSLGFTRDATGRVTGLSLNQGRARGLRFERGVPEP